MNEIFTALQKTTIPDDNCYYAWFIGVVEELYGDSIGFHPDRLQKRHSQYFGMYKMDHILKVNDVVGIEVDMLFANVLVQMKPTPVSNVPNLNHKLWELIQWRREHRHSIDPEIVQMNRKIRVFCNVLYGQMNTGKIWYHDIDQEDVSLKARMILAKMATVDGVLIVDMEEALFPDSESTEEKLLKIVSESGYDLDTIRHEYGRIIVRPNYLSVQRYKK